MTPSPDTVEHWTALIRDVLVDNEAIRDELSNDDAVMFMDWGRAQAGTIAARLRADADEEAVYEAGGTLSRLMSTMKRIIIKRREKDAEWLTSKLERLNELSQTLWGDAAPALTPEAINAWIAGHAARPNSDLLRDFMAHFTLPAKPGVAGDTSIAVETGDTDTAGNADHTSSETPDTGTTTPSTPLSASVDWHNLSLPGRTSPLTGETNDQE